MDIKGKVHCFFEQSGTFKNEFIKLGIPAEDYDIQNNFGETDHIMDLFAEIRGGYARQPSVFDHITSDDLIMAFFPCIYFCASSQMNMTFTCKNYRNFTIKKKTDAILERSANREKFFRLAVMMISVAEQRGLRLIMENPWNLQTFLKNNFIYAPTLVDNNRTMRGDYFRKPTAYWFVNCEPTHLTTYQRDKEEKTINSLPPNGMPGTCNEERSMISPDYARNFICDFIIGKPQKFTQLSIFEDLTTK